MIIKISNEKANGYFYYECDSMEYKTMLMEDVKSQNIDTALWLIDNDDNRAITVIFNLYKNGISKIIITTRLTYILNENGKTIDTLH